MQEGDTDAYTSIIRRPRKFLHEGACASLHQPNLIVRHRLVDQCLELALRVLNILISLHRVCLSRTSLSVGENCGMVTVDNLANHALNANALEEVALIGLTVTHRVELVGLRVFVTSIEVEADSVASHIHVHLT